MHSVRERLLRAVLARLSAAVAPVPVLRAPASPVRRDESPALLLFPETDAVIGHANALVDRALTFRLVAVARGIPDIDAERRQAGDVPLSLTPRRAPHHRSPRPGRRRR